LPKIQTRKKTKLEEHFDAMSKIKSNVWARENEWRLMWRNDETRMKIHRCSIPAEAITTIFLGLSVSEKVAADMLSRAGKKSHEPGFLEHRRRLVSLLYILHRQGEGHIVRTVIRSFDPF
jgi:hypothetical protein